MVLLFEVSELLHELVEFHVAMLVPLLDSLAVVVESLVVLFQNLVQSLGRVLLFLGFDCCHQAGQLFNLGGVLFLQLRVVVFDVGQLF